MIMVMQLRPEALRRGFGVLTHTTVKCLAVSLLFVDEILLNKLLLDSLSNIRKLGSDEGGEWRWMRFSCLCGWR